MPYRPGEGIDTVHPTPPPKPRAPRGPSPSPRPSYSAPSRSITPRSNPDLVTRGRVPYAPYRPQVTSMPAPYHYTPPMPVMTRNQRQAQTQSEMQRQIQILQQNGASDYLMSTALDAAIQSRYNFIVNTDRRQANRATNRLLGQFDKAQQDAYNPPSFGQGMYRITHGKPAVYEAPDLHLKQREALDPALPGHLGTLKQFNKLTAGMDPTQLSYMGKTYSAMDYAGGRDHSQIQFDKQRLRDARTSFERTKAKADAWAAQHPDENPNTDANGIPSSAHKTSADENVYGNVVDNGPNLGGIGHWLSGAADKVGGTIGDASNVIHDGLGMAHDLTPGSAVGDKIAGAVWNNELVAGTRHIAGEATGNALSWSIDKLSRPLYGVAGGYDEFMNYSGDHGAKNPLDAIFGSTLLGTSPLKALGHYAAHPAEGMKMPFRVVDRIKHEEFQNLGTHAEDPTMFQNVIANEAGRSKEQNIYDTHAYQVLAGVAGDMVGDPTMYLGVGAGAKAVTISKALGGGKELTKTAEGISSVLKEHNVYDIEPKAVEDLLTGGMRKLPKTVKDRVAGVRYMNEGHAWLHDRLAEAGRKAGADTSRIDSAAAQLRKAEIARATLSNSFKLNVQHDSLVNGIAKAVKDGELPAGSEQSVLDMIHTTAIQKNMARMENLRYKYQEANKAFPELKSKLGLGDDATWEHILDAASVHGAYKGDLPKLEAHATAAHGERAYDLLPESIKNSGLFTADSFDELLNKSHHLLMQDEGFAGKVYKQNMGRERNFKKAIGSTDNPYEIERHTSAMHHAQGKKLRARAAVVLQMVKDAAARKAGETVYSNPEYAANMQKIIDEVDKRLGRGAVGGSHVDPARAIDPEQMAANRQAFLEGEGYKARNFTDIAPHIDEQTGAFSDELFTADGGFYNGEQQLDRIRQFAERGLQRQNTVSEGGHVRGFGDLKLNEAPIELPEHLADPDILRHHLQIDSKGEPILHEVGDLTPEDHDVLNHMLDVIKGERENIVSSDLAKARARRGDEVTQRVKKTVEGERSAIQGAALKAKGFANRVILHAHGITPFVEHDGVKIKQGDISAASKLVNSKDQKRADELKNILDTARYPSSTKRPLDEKDMAKLEWMFKQNGYPLPVGAKALKTHEDWTEFLRGNAKFDPKDFETYAKARAEGIKSTDPIYKTAKVWTEPANIAFNRAFKEMHSELPWQTRSKAAEQLPKYDSKAREREIRSAAKNEQRPLDSKLGYDARRKQAAERARDFAIKQAIHGNLKTEQFHVSLHPSELPDYQELKAAMEAKHAQEIQAAKDAGKTDQQIGDTAARRASRLDSRIRKLRAQHATELKALEKARNDAIEAHQAYQKNLLSEARLRTIQSETAKQFGLKIHFVGGAEAFIPAPAVLAKSADQLGGLWLLRHTREIYAKAFRPPTAGMEQDLVRARNHRFGQTANIIESHVKELESAFGPMHKEDRIVAMNEFLNGAKTEGAAVVGRFFDNLVEYYNRSHFVPEEPLTIDRINAQLPVIYRSAAKDDIQDGKQLVESIRANADKRLAGLAKKISKTKDGEAKAALKKEHTELVAALKKDRLSDPYDMLWHLRIGIENAKGLMAFEHVIKNSFGIRRIGELKNGKFVHDGSELAKATERLGNKDTGWETIPALGNGHYFPSEIVGDVNRLIESMQPTNAAMLSDLFDQATRAWKGIATIYNPGYWTRNGLGEILATHMAGHNNPKDYFRSAKLIRYMNRDGKDLEAMKSNFPIDQPLVGEGESVKGSTVAFHMRSGEKITHEELALAMHSEGMKTGFFNTEFERNKLVDSMMSTPGLKTAVGAHRGLRNAGEDYETFLRAAHFISVIRKSSKPFKEAAAEAGMEVRKYHFDYTEFTPFEKQVMLRAFPFYKWTRRAIPLFMGMMFTKPGKMLEYPKLANAASDLLTTDDVKDDHNGLLPNYNTPTYTGIVPTWMQDLMAYQISGDQQTGLGTFLNVNTPQYDSLKSGFQPQQTALAMLNPFIKVPTEQVRGKTLGDTVGSFGYDLNDKDKGNLYRINELLGSVPAGRFAGRVGLDGNKLDLGQLISFGTGVGTYEDTPARQWGELQNRKNK